MRTILITGGAGFIGSALTRYIISRTYDKAIVFDALTYAGNLESLKEVSGSKRFAFEKGDVRDPIRLNEVFSKYRPNAVMHLAAESHVDRSIDGPDDFIQTNIIGTYVILEACRYYYLTLSNTEKNGFRFHHISTDEVFGDLGETESQFTENTPYAPSSPYSATKAASDHLVRAWHRTFSLPTLITNSSNNYGPYHFPEKLIPLMILNAREGKSLPVYGTGQQIRDWLFVDDHVEALYRVVTQGKVGETYNIGGNNEKKNLEVVRSICRILEELAPDKPKGVSRYEDLIIFVQDRSGHDLRYAIDTSKIARDLKWTPNESFDSGLRKTIEWYLDNVQWCRNVQYGKYNRERLGI